MRVNSSEILSRVLDRLHGPVGRRLGRLSRRTTAAVIAGFAVLAAVVAGIGWNVASADSSKLVGVDIPDRYMSAIETAARSCPMLTAARVAGQLMAESGLKASADDTESGGRGIAGLDDGDWRRWTPWPSAKRSNTSANIFALAHQMCDYSGQLRLAEVPGDPWELSLAAFRSGLAEVRTAGGVPESAAGYVRTATAYAAYYARQPEFGGSGPAPTVSPTPGKPVPDQYVEFIVAAGGVCPQVTPPAVAAVLMASSAFNPHLQGPDGEQGIARFRPDLWQRYGPTGTDAWEPSVAVPATGAALCGLITELSGIAGDPYSLALAAFRIGPDAVRQGGGVFDASTTTFLRGVEAYTAHYRLDTRLNTVVKPAPPASTTTAPTTTPPAPAPTTGRPEPTVTAPTTTPTTNAPVRTGQPAVRAKDTTGIYGPYFLHNRGTGMCADLPGKGAGELRGPIHQLGCLKTAADNQEWHFVPRTLDASGYQLYWIRNTDDNHCVDPPGTGAVEAGTAVMENKCYDNENQYFRLEPRFVDGGFQYYWLRNSASKYCLDLPGIGTAPAGTRLVLSPCLANDDQDWALIRLTDW